MFGILGEILRCECCSTRREWGEGGVKNAFGVPPTRIGHGRRLKVDGST